MIIRAKTMKKRLLLLKRIWERLFADQPAYIELRNTNAWSVNLNLGVPLRTAQNTLKWAWKEGYISRDLMNFGTSEYTVYYFTRCASDLFSNALLDMREREDIVYYTELTEARKKAINIILQNVAEYEALYSADCTMTVSTVQQWLGCSRRSAKKTMTYGVIGKVFLKKTIIIEDQMIDIYQVRGKNNEYTG